MLRSHPSRQIVARASLLHSNGGSQAPPNELIYNEHKLGSNELHHSKSVDVASLPGFGGHSVYRCRAQFQLWLSSLGNDLETHAFSLCPNVSLLYLRNFHLLFGEMDVFDREITSVLANALIGHLQLIHGEQRVFGSSQPRQGKGIATQTYVAEIQRFQSRILATENCLRFVARIAPSVRKWDSKSGILQQIENTRAPNALMSDFLRRIPSVEDDKPFLNPLTSQWIEPTTPYSASSSGTYNSSSSSNIDTPQQVNILPRMSSKKGKERDECILAIPASKAVAYPRRYALDDLTNSAREKDTRHFKHAPADDKSSLSSTLLEHFQFTDSLDGKSSTTLSSHNSDGGLDDSSYKQEIDSDDHSPLVSKLHAVYAENDRLRSTAELAFDPSDVKSSDRQHENPPEHKPEWIADDLLFESTMRFALNVDDKAQLSQFDLDRLEAQRFQGLVDDRDLNLQLKNMTPVRNSQAGGTNGTQRRRPLGPRMITRVNCTGWKSRGTRALDEIWKLHRLPRVNGKRRHKRHREATVARWRSRGSRVSSETWKLQGWYTISGSRRPDGLPRRPRGWPRNRKEWKMRRGKEMLLLRPRGRGGPGGEWNGRKLRDVQCKLIVSLVWTRVRELRFYSLQSKLWVIYFSYFHHWATRNMFLLPSTDLRPLLAARTPWCLRRRQRRETDTGSSEEDGLPKLSKV
ncbi:uncharacterized protein PAC_05634 [Phialocephala subalpina]|uniref:Uncharacterized protein n=1 Tax=Phialocephala subalpina TaxID=576137 RepID=A0A1L7WSL3_9HELO|nr:uncharacterized protein PAC_05634 [Phialocephala subalpina]